jgi:endonuclease/exonuclease/phosphatase family metal-dependent hydrolase
LSVRKTNGPSHAAPKRRRRGLLGPALFAACLAWALTSTFARPARAEAAPVPLRVLSFNVWDLPVIATNREARLAALPDAIAKLEPDVILLQELWIESDGDRLRKALARRGYPYTTHLAHTEYGMTGLFVASKLPLKYVGYHPFAGGSVEHSFWHLEWLAAKGVATFVVKTSLGELEIQNTHLQAQYETDGYAAERLSQAGEILLIDQDRTERPLVLGGDFNSGAEELPRRCLTALDALNDTTPSPRPDTIYVRSGGSIAIRTLATRQAFDKPLRLANGVTTELSDHAAVVVDLELSGCSNCAPPAVSDTKMREAACSALISAADITPWRMILTLSTAASLLVIAISLVRRASGLGFWRRAVPRRIGLGLLATGIVWTLYLGVFYYPARAKALRFVAQELADLRVR